MAFVKTHLPCESCGSSDALCINEDGSTKCFSCGEYIINNKEEKMIEPLKKYTSDKSSLDNQYGAVYGPLIDRKISKETAQKYGVKVVYNDKQ
jgi:twinkle protein